jgi:hypothetical protein
MEQVAPHPAWECPGSTSSGSRTYLSHDDATATCPQRKATRRPPLGASSE